MPFIEKACEWMEKNIAELTGVGNKNGNYLYLIKDLKANADLGISDNEYIHYEQACEEAIKYCLINLI